MTLKLSPIVVTLIIAGVLILVFALFKGCKQSRVELADKIKVQQIADSTIKALKEYKLLSDSSTKEFQDTIEFERGQLALAINQKERAEAELDKALADNIRLTEKHKLAKYTDTTSTVVPAEYVQDCENCFIKLENTTNLSLRYKGDLNALQRKQDDQNLLYQNRFKQLEQEKLGFYNKISLLTKEQKETVDKLKPHGMLFLSWGVIWKPWPWAGGAGLLYQAKNNMIYGAKWYYGSKGQMIETTLNFPLSIKL